MKRIAYAMMSTLSALVLLLGYRTSTSSQSATTSLTVSGTSTSSTATGSSASSGQTSSSAGSPPTTSSATGSTSTAAKAFTGTATDTRYGPVQVRLTVQSGKITNVTVVQYPNGNGRDQEINANALPILVSETIKAQNAKIDSVSGATYTSQGYLTSLQSALDQAGL